LIGRLPLPRQAAFATVRDPASGERIDQALALWFPGPASETGEDTAELQIHGGQAVIAATLRALAAQPGLRLAEPGEFTRRAFENGRIDLTEVEGLADLIGAETEQQRRQAFRQLTGALRDRAETWRKRLIEAQALIEAGLDFSDEGDVTEASRTKALQVAASLREEIAAVLADAARGERVREGFTVAIAGPPNAGKSSLFNALARREAAIVSPIPGTTRDVLEVHLDLGGYAVTVFDTAGIRPTDDPVEQIGVERAKARAEGADLVLWITDASAPVAPSVEARADQKIWVVRNKADLLASGAEARENPREKSGTDLWISALTGQGLADLEQRLAAAAGNVMGGREPALVTRVRQRVRLEEAATALGRAAAPGLPDDLVAEELRTAATALGRLTGRIDVEDVLDALFGEFCIGK
jgi:tRNA modification GTPase